ncbi:MAG: TIGR03862 family flavoprotein [Oxalicibacterium faecigallinarum]|uniref:TIGR03862 family flavoprotein n=1 Tax=Oxalicibacterium faecigallinarum TaxID=573741 RepID=UPI00280892A5|nr:TIGR03862 family flavoprotein [Oxalicibacterium faecigallinarum]MDQ7968278.1 TIGR03862 family flavoprotein [Oxalicibacterium faecigallinarum]
MNARVAVIGGGPAGLMAAETIAAQGIAVDLYDAMPSVGRKFLLAGKGGMNLTHAEPAAQFVQRYGSRSEQLAPILARLDADALRLWAKELGIETFVGSSQRVFPIDMKAAPLLRAWLKRLRDRGVQFHMRHRWLGWHGNDALRFATPDGEHYIHVDAVVLALGGGSWARLGSDGKWLPVLQAQGIISTPLKPANCGFDVAWSEHFRTRFAGEPVKSVVASCHDVHGALLARQGEFVIAESGVEGSLIYALSSALRDRLGAEGHVTLTLDLAPGKSAERVLEEVSHPRGARSLSSHLQSKVGIAGVKAGLLREVLDKDEFSNPTRLAATIKALPLTLHATRPLDEAISSAGGVCFESLTGSLMSKTKPGLFCAGEMLDWEAPTGGYLLTACFASGRIAGEGVLHWLQQRTAG